MCAFALCEAAQCVSSDAVVVRSMENRRLWQTNFTAGEPLSWRWESATCAVVTITNHTLRQVLSVSVTRTGNELFGSMKLDLPSEFETGGVECLLDVLLELYAGDSPLSIHSARVACLPGANGRAPIVVRACLASEWKVNGSIMLAYDSAWYLSSAEEISLQAVGATSGIVANIPSEGLSGYVPFRMRTFLPQDALATLSMVVDGGTCETVRLRWADGGFILCVR